LLILIIETLRNHFQSIIEFSGMSDAAGNIDFDSNIQLQKWEAFSKYKIDVRVPNPSTDGILLEFTRKVPKGYEKRWANVQQNQPTEGYFHSDFALRKGKNILNVKHSRSKFKSNVNVNIILTMFFEDTNTIELTDQVINKAKIDPDIKNVNVVCGTISDRLIEYLLGGGLYRVNIDYKAGFDFEIPNTSTIMKAYVKLPKTAGEPFPIQVRILPDEKYIQMRFQIYLGFRLKNSNEEYAIVESVFSIKITPEMKKDTSEVLKLKANEGKLTFNNIQIIKQAIVNQQFPPTPTNPTPFTTFVQNVLNNIKDVTNVSVNYSLIIPNFIQYIEFPDAWNRTEDFLIFFKKFYWEKGIVGGKDAGFLFPVFTVKGLTGCPACIDKEKFNVQISEQSQKFPNIRLEYVPSSSWFAFAFSQESFNEITNTMIQNKINKHEKIPPKSKTIQPFYAEGRLEYFLELKLNKITILDNELHFDFEFASVGGKISLMAKDKVWGDKVGDWHFGLTLIFSDISVLSTIGIEEFHETEIPSNGEDPIDHRFIRIHTDHVVSLGKIEVDADITGINNAVDWVVDFLLSYVIDENYRKVVEGIANLSLNKRPYLITFKSERYDETHMPKNMFIDTVYNRNSSLILIGNLETSY
ncbi:MAG TPA: hypothetical protein VJ697_00200, partial [Nitrososphaeraceae archaeon]|nr:hypothetical protein [Nitrososphaeraceae archaeon]